MYPMQCAFRAKDNESVFMQCAKVFSVQWLPRFGGFPQHPPEAPTLPYPIINTSIPGFHTIILLYPVIHTSIPGYLCLPHHHIQLGKVFFIFTILWVWSFLKIRVFGYFCLKPSAALCPTTKHFEFKL